jgi:hypothetical protein
MGKTQLRDIKKPLTHHQQTIDFSPWGMSLQLLLPGEPIHLRRRLETSEVSTI